MLRLALKPGRLGLAELRQVWQQPVRLSLPKSSRRAVDAAFAAIAEIVASGTVVYGVNTGFGLLAQTRIKTHELQQLQSNLVLSHSAGVGEPLPDEIVRLILVLKIASLARGHSGVAWSTITALQNLLEAEAYPLIPAQGSVGASGDLAPLAHLSAALLGHGQIRWRNEVLPAGQVLQQLQQEPLQLAAKEGLALLNGTQVSTALALAALFRAEEAFAAALLAGAMAVDAAKGSDTPFDARIHALRGQSGQMAVAQTLRELLAGSEIRASHISCNRVQDPYSLRCQPQVMGACLDLLSDTAVKLAIEANAVSDNPLVFAAQGEVLSGGNFHAEPVALAADTLALALAEIGNLSERRTALLVDPHMSGLPAFLVENSGLNSGFMIAQVTAAALASENRQRAHPASCDSIPTSANQEDHVSMATHAARRSLAMANDTCAIAAIETLAVAQGIEFHRPYRSSPTIEAALASFRERVPRYQNDRFFHPDIEAAAEWVRAGIPLGFLAALLPSTVGDA